MVGGDWRGVGLTVGVMAAQCPVLISESLSTIITIMVIMGCRMIRETNAVQFRQNLGDMLNQVQYRQDSIVINKDGKPVAALVDARLFERIRRMQGRFDALARRLEDGFAGTPEADGMAEIDAAVEAERRAPTTR